MYLQNGRYIIIERIIVTTRIVFFHIKSHPIALRIDLFNSTSGSPPSSVPAGQISLQKYGAPCPMMSTTNIGSRITNTINITYFSLRNSLSPRNVRIFFGNDAELFLREGDRGEEDGWHFADLPFHFRGAFHAVEVLHMIEAALVFLS